VPQAVSDCSVIGSHAVLVAAKAAPIACVRNSGPRGPTGQNTPGGLKTRRLTKELAQYSVRSGRGGTLNVVRIFA